MEAHSSKRFECRKCGTKFVHQKSYEQHQRAMCLGHRKRIAARKLQIAIPECSDSEDIPKKGFTCKYCNQEYNYARTMEIHVQQKHPEHEGDISLAYTSYENGMEQATVDQEGLDKFCEELSGKIVNAMRESDQLQCLDFGTDGRNGAQADDTTESAADYSGLNSTSLSGDNRIIHDAICPMDVDKTIENEGVMDVTSSKLKSGNSMGYGHDEERNGLDSHIENLTT